MLKFSLFLALASVLALAACSKPESTAEAEAATPVEVATARRQPIEETVNAEAILYPIKQANVVPKISAPVARFLVQRGDHVRQGQLVAVLENGDLAAAAQESEDL